MFDNLNRHDPQAGSEGLAAKFSRAVAHYFGRAAETVRIWHERSTLEHELMKLDDAGLADLGIVRGQIRALVEAHPAANNQLNRMIVRLGIAKTGAQMDPLLHDDLYRTCVMCTERRRCRAWLDSAGASDGYRTFCPNRRTFDRLLALRAEDAGKFAKMVH